MIHRDSASHCTPTDIKMLSFMKEEQQDLRFHSVLVPIFFSFMTSFQPGIYRASDADLGIKYESKEEMKA